MIKMYLLIYVFIFGYVSSDIIVHELNQYVHEKCINNYIRTFHMDEYMCDNTPILLLAYSYSYVPNSSSHYNHGTVWLQYSVYFDAVSYVIEPNKYCQMTASIEPIVSAISEYNKFNKLVFTYVAAKHQDIRCDVHIRVAVNKHIHKFTLTTSFDDGMVVETSNKETTMEISNFAAKTMIEPPYWVIGVAVLVVTVVCIFISLVVTYC